MSSWLDPVAVLNAVSRFGAYRVASNLAYGEGPRRRLDIYSPLSGAGCPVVVFFYGGNWEEGERDTYRFVGAALAAKGVVAIVPDYRLYPEVRFPGFLEDGAQAIRWARDHARQFGGDPDRIVLMGHSAGAHIAAMLAFDPQWLRVADLDIAHDIRGVVGLSGPYDFLPLKSERLIDIFGPEAQRPRTQPINVASAAAPPALLATAVEDDVVSPGNTYRLAERLRSLGTSVSIRTYGHVDHRTMIGAFSLLLRPLAPVLGDVMAFIGKVAPSSNPCGRSP